MHGFRRFSPFARLAAASLAENEVFKLIQVGGGASLGPEWDTFGDRLSALALTSDGADSADKRIVTGSYMLGEPERQPAAYGARTGEAWAKALKAEPKPPSLQSWLSKSKGWPARRGELGLLAAVQAAQFADPDFVELTNSAAGLSTLRALEPVLRQPKLQGVSLQINLFGSHEPDANTLHNVDRLLREAGLQPFALSVAKYGSAALPWPFMNAYPAETFGGRPLLVYATYLREEIGARPAALLKAAALRALIDMPDQAAEILVMHSSELAAQLDVAQGLELLTQEIQTDTGQSHKSYAEHLAAFQKGAQDFYSFAQRNGDWLTSLIKYRKEAAERIDELQHMIRGLISELNDARNRQDRISPDPVKAMIERAVDEVGVRSRLAPGHHWIFDHYRAYRGPADLRMQIDFLGCRTLAEYGASSLDVQYDDFHSAFPDVDEEYFEWIDVLQAVLEAGPVFTMLELGAGYGRWSARAAAAAKQLGKQVRLGAAEAEPKHKVWLDRHLRFNGVSPDDFHIFGQAVGGEHGEIAFTVGQDEEREDLDGAWFGQAGLDVELQALEPSGEYFGAPVYRWQGWHLIRVPKIPLSEVLQPYEFIDLADFDLQGAEYDAIAEAIEPLTRKVRRLHIGTHGEEIEAQLRELLTRHGWVKLRDYSLHKTHQTPFGPAAFVDGVQSWINPALIQRSSTQS